MRPSDVRWPGGLVPAIACGLAVLVVAVFFQTGSFGYVPWDDPGYVTENPRVRQGLSLGNTWWAMTTLEMSNWHPLTWLSYMVDVELFGVDAGAMHRVNVALHAFNSAFLFLLLHRLTGSVWPGALAAALFAVHPLHVESVAWISERKDLLSTAFMLLTISAYGHYARSGRRWQYGLAMLWFTLGLMSKPMLVTLPFVLLLLDVWPLERIRVAHLPALRREAIRLVLEKIPMLALSALVAGLTLVAQSRGGSVSSLERLPLDERVANAALAYVGYLWKTLWPAELSYFYPLDRDVSPALAAAAVAVLLVATVVALLQAGKRPFLLVGWLWYLGTLVPVIGIVQVGMQSMADRYTYVPLIGIFIAVAWTLAGLRLHPWLKGSLAGGVVLALAVASAWQAPVWRDGERLFLHALRIDGANAHALANLAAHYEREGRTEEAAQHARRALEVSPASHKALITLGNVLRTRGDAQGALDLYTRAAASGRRDPIPAYNAGLILHESRRYREALPFYEQALSIRPEYVDAMVNRGAALAALGRQAEARDAYRRAIAIAPDDFSARYNLATLLEGTGELPEAERQMREALRIAPGNQRAQRALTRIGQRRLRAQ